MKWLLVLTIIGLGGQADTRDGSSSTFSIEVDSKEVCDLIGKNHSNSIIAANNRSQAKYYAVWSCTELAATKKLIVK